MKYITSFLEIDVTSDTLYVINNDSIVFYPNKGDIVYTDKNGLSIFYEKIEKHNSKVIIKDIEIDEINYNNKNIVFINDSDEKLEYVQKTIPNCICYKFINSRIGNLGRANINYDRTISKFMEIYCDGVKIRRRNIIIDNCVKSRFYLYTENEINKNYNLIIFYHGSRDLAWEQIYDTNLLKLFPDFIIVFGQCDITDIKAPYYHKSFHNIAFGEIYWEIRDCESQFYVDIEYTKKIIDDMKSMYNIKSIFHIGHSNGGVFNLQLAIHMPNIFTGIISHQGGLGYDCMYNLDFEKLVDNNFKKTPILLISGEYDVHKSVCKQAQLLFKNEGFNIVDYIEFENEYHGYKISHEECMINWIKNLLAKD